MKKDTPDERPGTAALAKKRAWAEYYARNKARESLRSQEKRRALICAVKKVLAEHLSTHSCIDCGESDPIVLEFDHLNPKVKLFSMAQARRGKHSLARVIAEMGKCAVRCANCHRRVTARQAADGVIRFGFPVRIQ